MEGEDAMRDSAIVDLASAPGAPRSQTLVAGGIAVILFVVLGGAWVFMIGARPCPLSYLWWR